MDSSTCIEQKGVVEEISNGMARVNINMFSACAGCHAKKACNFIDARFRHIMVPTDGNHYSIGETVGIIMKRSLGLKASFIAYFIPLALLIVTLLVLTSLRLNEVFAGILTLLILAPYFILVYRFREKLTRTFTIRLRKES
ncbi:hypothetical protein ES705_20876 [subsurface metagenome]